MLINSTYRLRIPNLPKLLFLFLFSCFSAALLAQAFTAQTLKSAKISESEIVSKTDTFCGAAFFKRLFIQGQSTAGYQIVPASNGDFFLTAAVGEKTMIALADRKMEILWAKSVDMGLGAESVLDMRLDSEGYIIAVGNTSLLPVECFAFKMNAVDGQLIWLSKLNDPGNSYFTRILEKNSGANYLLFGQTDLVGTTGTGCDALLMEIDRNTGELLWDRQYDLGSCEIVNDVFIENSQIYVCGRYNLVDGGQSRFRAALSLFDTAGNLQWSRHYVRDDDQDATMYFNALVHENDSLVAFGWGNDAGTSLTATTLQLVKTDLTGTANWAKKYDIVGGNEERSARLFSLPDGYLLFGNFARQTVASREICLLKTDKQGNFLWGKSYGGLGEDRLSDVILVSDTIYLIGSRQNAQIFDILIGKLDLNGDVDSQCGFVKSLDVIVSDYAAPLDFTHNLEELDITHNYATAALPAQTAENDIVTEVICQKICDSPCDTVHIVETIEFCPGDSVFIGGTFYTQPGTAVETIPGIGGDCDTIVTYTLAFDISFLKTFGAPNSDEAALGVYDAKDGNLYVSGVVGGDSLIIIKMTPAGDILWSDRINFINDRIEYIAEMFVDDEGMLVGAGTFSNFQYGFTFRYDPVAHNFLWAHRIILLDNHILGIVQKPNTGNYRLYLNFPVPFQGGSRAAQWDLSKTTGFAILGTAAEYQVDTADLINNMVLHQGKMYACGSSTFQGFGAAGKRQSLMRFDLNGNVEWARLGPADQNTDQWLTGRDLIIDDDHIISIYSGNDNGTNLDNTTIFLQKNTLNGDVVWVREFDLGDGFTTETVEEVVSVADGYVLMGHNRIGPGDLFFLKTDKEGHLMWAKKLDIANDNFAGFGSEQSQLLAADNGLYFAAMTQNAAGKSDMLVGSLNLKGEIGVDCGFVHSLDVVETTLNPVQNTPVNLLKFSHGSTGGPFQIPPVPASTSLLVNTACSGCEPPGCDTVYLVQTIEFCPGDIVQIGGEEYTQPGTVIDTISGTAGCDTIVTYTLTLLPYNVSAQTIEFCPGDIVQIGSEEYTQPGTVLDTIPGTGTDCDTVVTYTLQFYQNSIVQIQCPANISAQAASGANSAMVNYNLPTANTDCPCGLATPELLQGLASGSDFPVGVTQVCYQADDDCGGANSCCFTVTVQAAPPEEACDVKQTSCVKFEILGIFQNPAKQRTYRMRVTNSCANKLIYTTFQLPDGVVADVPATNTTYTAPSGRQYEVRNPNFSPAYSIRFKAIGDGIANGQSDVFEYTLPPQSEPLYIHATAKLFPQIFVETHLNTFNCPVQQTSNRPAETKEREGISNPAMGVMTIFPNPASDVLNLRLSNWENQQIQLRVTDAYGRLMFEQISGSASNLLTLELPTDWPTGIYYLEAVNEKGERQTGRFVRGAK